MHHKARTLYQHDRRLFNEKAVLNIARSGKFSSDRTIAEYASDIWGVKSCPVERDLNGDTVLADAAKH